MISSLRDRVTLLAPVRTADLGGGFALSYMEKETIAARRTSLSARRAGLAGRQIPVRRQRFTFRYRDDLIFEMQLRHQDLLYKITDIVTDEQNRFQTVTAEEVRP